MDELYKKLELQFKTDLEKLQWEYVVTRLSELYKNGFNARIVIDVQGGRINSLQDQGLIAGTTQTLHYLTKIEI